LVPRLSRERKERNRAFLPLLTILTLLTVPLYAQQPAVAVLPATPRQGEPLRISLAESGVTRAHVTWRGKTYPLYQDDGGWSGFAPINSDTPPGPKRLTVEFTRDGRAERLEKTVNVGAVKWAVQHLTMARNTARLYNFPGAKREDAIVYAAVRTESPRRLWHGDWVLPARGRTSTPWGVRRIRSGAPVGRHKGLDIAAPTGTPVSAPAAGRVVLAATFKKYGNAVVVDHGQGITSLYLHMSALAVKKGQTLEKGSPIGKVGMTGVATGPHLHWSVYVHGESLTPLFFTRLDKVGIREPLKG
jgi:murein DD-endopeptidase MepM/ murein hydrolase activator NlpD